MITKEDVRNLRDRGYKRYRKRGSDWPKAWEAQNTYETTIYVHDDCVSLTVRDWKSYPKHAEINLNFACMKDALACETILQYALSYAKAESQGLIKRLGLLRPSSTS